MKNPSDQSSLNGNEIAVVRKAELRITDYELSQY